jgi:peptidoglycan/LPS O-acetylase OafA/YrhL
MHISRVPYLPGLDGLRAVAVVAVMLYHADLSGRHMPWIPGGFLGVEVFFVISGYLITLLMIAEQERSAWQGRGGLWRRLKAFWLRRARRLLPAVLVMIAFVVSISGLVGYLRDEVKLKLGWSPLFGVFYTSNWYQLFNGQSYDVNNGRPPLLRHLWSLGVEEQFYLLWPIVMLLVLPRFWKRLPDLGLVLWGVALGLWIISATMIAGGINWNWVYLGSQSRAIGLLFGGGMAMFWRPLAISRSPLRRKGWLLSTVGLLGLAALAWCFWKMRLDNPNEPNKPYKPLFYGGMLLVDAATMLVIASATHLGSFFGQKILGNRLFRWIGTRSYGMYLWHWPIFQLTRPDGGRFGPGDLAIPFWQVMALRFVLTVSVTELSYRLVETPIRRGGFANWVRPVRVTSPITGRSRRRKGWIVAVVVVVLPVFAGTRIVSAASKTDEQVASERGQRQTCSIVLRTCGAVLQRQQSSPDAATTTNRATTDPGAGILDPAATNDGSAVVIGRVGVSAVGHASASDSASINATPPSTPGSVSPAGTSGPAGSVAPAASPTAAVVPESTVATVVAPVVPALTGSAEPAPGGPAPVDPAAPAIPSGPNGPLRMLAIGDSVMLGAAPALTARGVGVDAKKNRQFHEGVDIVTAAHDQGLLGDVLIVHLGTNGTMSSAGIATMMQAAKDVPLVIFLTLHVPSKPWQDPNNAIIRGLPNVYPNVRVLDWQMLSEHQPGIFYTDAIHLRPAGQAYYTQLIVNLIAAPR